MYTWDNARAKPELMFFRTPFGGLRVTPHMAFLIDDFGNALEDQSNAAAAFAWLKEQTGLE
jgi:hypothetical protein